MTLLVVTFVAWLVVKARRRIGRRAVAALLAVVAILGFNVAAGAPAVAQDDDCAEAPMPEVPGAGMVGTFDPPHGQGGANSPYVDYGYAGMVWHTYDTDCGPLDIGVTSPTTTLDTWLGNQLFDIGKALVAATNGLHYTLMDGGLLAEFTDPIRQAAVTVFGSVFTQLVSLVLLLLAVQLLVWSWRGAFSAVSRRGLIALGALGVAASAPALVAHFPVVDDLIVTTTTGIQAGVLDLDQDDQIVRDGLPTILHNTVVYQSWLRGEFGAPDHPKAVDNPKADDDGYGSRLLNAQAFTRDEHTNPAAIQAKQDEYRRIATELDSAKGYFTGEEGSRTGAGFLALVQALAYTIFPLLAKLGVLLAQLLLRILTLAAPFIGLAALIYPHTLRKVGKALGTIAFTVLVLAILAGIHTRFLQIILSPNAKLSLLVQVTLALLVTVTFLLVAKPFRRIQQMLALATDAAVPTAIRGIMRRRARAHPSGALTAQQMYWEQLTHSHNPLLAAPHRPRGFVRPEAQALLPVPAQHRDPLLQPAGFVIASQLHQLATVRVGAQTNEKRRSRPTAGVVDQHKPVTSTSNAPEHDLLAGSPPSTTGAPPTGGPDRLIREDDDFSARQNRLGRKSHLDHEGNLQPANPEGTTTPREHVLGARRPQRKANSPYTSFKVDDGKGKTYGSQYITIDHERLRRAIDAGQVRNIEMLPPDRVQQDIQDHMDRLAGRPVEVDLPLEATPEQQQQFVDKLGLSKRKSEQVMTDVVAMLNTRRDSEWLIKGTVPSQFIEGPHNAG